MSKSYNPEYYGTSDSQGTARELYEGEVSVVENIANESEAKAAIIEPDESVFPSITISEPRELYDTEINVVENLKNMEENKDNIIVPEESDNETVDEEVYHSELETGGPRELYPGEVSVVKSIEDYESNKEAIISATKYN